MSPSCRGAVEAEAIIPCESQEVAKWYQSSTHRICHRHRHRGLCRNGGAPIWRDIRTASSTRTTSCPCWLSSSDPRSPRVAGTFRQLVRESAPERCSRLTGGATAGAGPAGCFRPSEGRTAPHSGRLRFVRGDGTTRVPRLHRATRIGRRPERREPFVWCSRLRADSPVAFLVGFMPRLVVQGLLGAAVG